MVMYGDLITKQIILDRQIEKRKKSGKKITTDFIDELTKELDMLFVNYGYKTSPVQMWSEKVGGVLFLKYLFRNLKAVKMLTVQNPVQMALTQGGQYYTGINLADNVDTYTKGNIVDNILNREVLDDPSKVLYDYIAPNMLEPFKLDFSDLVKIS
jgi:hypothetical protein